MTLATDLTSNLDVSARMGTFSTAVDTHRSDDPDEGIGSLSVDVDTGTLDEATRHADNADLSNLGPQVTAIVERLEPLLARLPIAGDAITPITGALATFERLFTGNLGGDVTGMIGSIEAELRGDGDGFPALLLRIIDLLRTNPTAEAVGELVNGILRLAGAPRMQSGVTAPARDVIAALDGALRVTGGLMACETDLAEAERVTTLAAQQLDRDALDRLIARADAAFGGEALANFVRDLDVDDPAAVEAALAAVAHARRALGLLIDALATGLGLGEATLIYVDLPSVETRIARSLQFIRGGDLAPTRRLVASAMDALRPYLGVIDPDVIPELTIDALLDQIEALVATAAGGIESIDTAGAIKPVADILAKVADVTRTIADALEGVVDTVRSALGEVRGVIAALPFDDIADAIRTALEPISTALDFLRGVVDTISGTIEDTATEAKRVLGLIEKTVDDLQADIDEFFGKAKEFIDGLHLDQIMGQVQDNIRGLAELIGRAHMKPYFDTAVEVIGTTADVVGAIPFSLLPDSMEAEVDNALKPIRDVDADGFKEQIKSVLQITPEGKFALRDEIEDGLHDLQEKYLEVLQVIKDNHPRKYLAQLDDKLAGLADDVRNLSPQLSLQPLADAIDKVRDAVTEFDLSAQLEPVRAVFRRIDEIIDQYNPAALLRPIEERLDQARAQLVDTLKLDQWGPTITGLRDQALGKLDAIDPIHQTARLTELLQKGRRALAELPGGSPLDPLGNLVCMALMGSDLKLSPDSFATVRPWLTGAATASSELVARAGRIAAAIDAMTASVNGLDVGALGTRMSAAARAVRNVIASDKYPEGSPLRLRFEVASSGMEPEAAFASLIANQTRYRQVLAGSAAAVETLRRTGFSTADDGVTGLRNAFAPVRPVTDLGRRILGRIGLRDLDRGFRGIAEDVFDQIEPARVAGLLTPIITAVRDRLRLLIDALLVPILDSIGQLERSVAAIDLTPIVDAIQGLVDETKAQIAQLSPDVLLAGPLGSFTALQDTLRDFDPLGVVIHLLEAIRDTVARLLDKLHAERILRVPLQIVDDLLHVMEQLDFDNLLAPVFDALDGLAGEVSTGLDDTVSSFKRLQQSLPSGGGGGASASLTGSIG
jgi:hypothetical protein